MYEIPLSVQGFVIIDSNCSSLKWALKLIEPFLMIVFEVNLRRIFLTAQKLTTSDLA